MMEIDSPGGHSKEITKNPYILISQFAFMKIYRISLSSQSYARLTYLAASQEIKPNSLLEHWINDQWEHRDNKPEIQPIQSDNKPHMPHDSKRPNLADSPEELARIKDLHDRLSVGQIAREIDRPKSTVALAIKRMREKGEL